MTRLHHPRRTPRHTRRSVAIALACLAATLATTSTPRLASAAPADTAADVMAWLDDVDPAIVIDHSAQCMNGAAVAVAYRGDRIVLRTGVANGVAAAAVNGRLNVMYGGPPKNWVAAIERITFPLVPGGGVITPVLSVSLLPRPGGIPHDVVTLARRLRNDTGKVASPDYALVPSGPYSFFWPNGYPEAVADLTPPRANLTPGGTPIGTGVKIGVYDTGLAPPPPGALPRVTQLSSGDDEQPDRDQDGRVDYPHAGHGLAIAGVLAVVAPGAAVQEVRISARNGLATDVSAVRGMASSLRAQPRAQWPSVLVNAFGSAACDIDPAAPGPELLPVGLEAMAELVDRFDPHQPRGMMIVASAGNIASRRPHYPAAFPSVVGVGALDATIDGDASSWSAPGRTAPIAEFSNRGASADVWAPGVDLVTTHLSGLAFEIEGDAIHGKASVDGTSFAAPLFAGLVAERMSTSNVTARLARTALVAAGAPPLPQCGTTRVEAGVSVTLASLSSTATGQPTGAPVTC